MIINMIYPLIGNKKAIGKMGQWIKADGQKYYHSFPEFHLMIEKHKKLHLASLQLNKLSSDMLDCLNLLRNKAVN